MLVVMNKLELVRKLRKIAASENCHLTLKAASKIADWIKGGTTYDITDVKEVIDPATEARLLRADIEMRTIKTPSVKEAK